MRWVYGNYERETCEFVMSELSNCQEKRKNPMLIKYIYLQTILLSIIKN